jgi:hypothetical protein
MESLQCQRYMSINIVCIYFCDNRAKFLSAYEKRNALLSAYQKEIGRKGENKHSSTLLSVKSLSLISFHFQFSYHSVFSEEICVLTTCLHVNQVSP